MIKEEGSAYKLFFVKWIVCVFFKKMLSFPGAQ